MTVEEKLKWLVDEYLADEHNEITVGEKIFIGEVGKLIKETLKMQREICAKKSNHFLGEDVIITKPGRIEGMILIANKRNIEFAPEPTWGGKNG